MTSPDSRIRTAEQLSVALAGKYVLEREIGAGGMATVYLARDVRHNRRVALKFLRPDLGAALGAERFFAEIQVTASLQHPNLLPLFDSGEAQIDTGDGVSSMLFYAMPYVEGQTLRDRLKKEGQLPIEETLSIASGIAGALDYAHRHGVVHRDLKPENILLHEGQPLVMDFGIALAVSHAGGERLTQMGISLGTPQYMSPEQATGDRELDARTDIYSLGAVVYEMLAGTPPHSASTAQALIAKVIMDRPVSVRATRELVPAHIDAAVTRALAKLPADRFATAADFARALTGDHALALRESRALAAAPQKTTLSTFIARPAVKRVAVGTAWLTIFGIAAAAGAFVTLAMYTAPSSPFIRFPVLIPDSVAIPGLGRAIAISPDGSRLALAGGMSGQGPRILSRPMNGVSFGPLHGTDHGTSPSFSPDGESILFVADGRLLKVAAEGGAALPLADSTDGQHSWGEHDVVVFIKRGSVWSVPAGGGSPHLVAKPDSSHGIRAYAWPDVLPGGRHALVTVIRMSGTSPDSNRIGVMSLGDGTVTDLGVMGTGARYASPGHMVYATAGGSLWAAPFSARKRTITGDRALLADGVHVDSSGAADVAVSAKGTLVYGESAGATPRGGTARVAVAVVDRSGAIKTVSAQQGDFIYPRISPDANRVALTVRTSTTRSDVWIFEIATGQLTPMTRDALSQYPEWIDSRRIVFRENSVNPGRYMIQPADHSAIATPFLIPNSGGGTISPAVSVSFGAPSGYFAFVRDRIGTSSALHQDIWIASQAHPETQQQFISSPASELAPRMSPNGKWVAYTSNESSAFQLYVQPVPGPGARVPVSVEHGIEPMWSRDGKLLYYTSHSLLLAAHVNEASGFSANKQDTLFSFADKGFVVHNPPARGPSLGFYDVFPNGDIAVLVRGSSVDNARSSVIALTHWEQLLKSGAGARK